MKRFLHLFAFACVIALLWAAYTLFGGQVADAFNTRAAEQAVEAGDLERAAGLYTRVLERSPRNERLRLKVSGLYRDAGNYSRAEFTIFAGLRDVGPSAALYQALCTLYVEQDKLYDAVRLLDDISRAGTKDEIEARRPVPPVFTPSGGLYEERIGVDVTAGDRCVVYVSWTGAVPSTSADLFTGTVSLGPGVTRAQAVAVDADGLVSGWAYAEFTLENIVDPVVFADPAMEQAVRETIGRLSGPLYTPDLWDITELFNDDEADYQTLDDLRFMPRLQKLGLTGVGGRCDISFLPSLEALTVLQLRFFGVDSPDLEIIGRCAGLEQLYLPGNKIGQVRPLEGLERLVVLDLSYNSILDVTPLGRLTALERLYLTQNAIQGIEGLASLAKLAVLHIGENLLSTLAGLDQLTALEILDLSFNPGLTSIDEAERLRSLKILSAPRCQIEELPDMNRLTVLEELYLGHNMLQNLSGLRGLPALRILHASDNAITSLEPLNGCTALVILDVSRNVITSVESLRGLPALVSLNIEHNAVKTLVALKDCPALNEVFAYGNGVADPLNTFNGTRLEGKVQW